MQLKDKFDFEKQLERMNEVRRAKMFESVKIIRECKSILKKHNIKYNVKTLEFSKDLG